MNRQPGSPLLCVALLAVALWLPGLAAARQPAPDVPAEEGAATEQEPEQEALSATGDPWVDAQLADIDRYGRRHREAFIDELVRYREAPRGLVAALLDERGWEPGEVYFACSLAGVTGRSCRFIVDQRGQPPAASWRALATGVGAGPGTDGFARIKRGMVYSYRRWARPLELDAELAQAFPEHGQPPSRGAAAAEE